MHTQVGVTRWARQDSNLTSENPASDIENKENAKTEEEGGAKCAPLQDKSEQFTQLLQALKALTQDERSALLQALTHDEGA
jgi:DNA-directed RNA polymerase specialized sigma24 family protein